MAHAVDDRHRFTHVRALLASVVWLLSACLGDLREIPADDSCLPGAQPLFPLAVGNWWIYQTADAVSGLRLECKTNVVTGVEQTASGSLYEIEKLDSKPNTSWLLDTGKELGWVRKLWRDPRTGVPSQDDYYEPYMLRLDYAIERLCAGGLEYSSSHVRKTIDITTCRPQWNEGPAGCPSESVELRHVDERWTVLEPRDCTVERDERACLCVNRHQLGSGGDVSQGTFCFARGIGKVFERTDLLEQLVAHCLDGPACPAPPHVEQFAQCK